MLETILALASQKFGCDAEFEREFNLKPKTVYDWKRGKSSSYKNMLVELSIYFNVSTDYLLGKTDKPTTTNDSEVNDLQDPLTIEYVKLLRTLSPDLLDAEISHLRNLVEIEKKKNK